jgi:hypothetical protein
MYLTVVAFASLLMMSFNLQTNMNSNMQAYASIFSDIQNADDIGQSLECVIVVVGCDAQGSVGSSGDVNIGVGDNDTTTDDPDTPVPIDCAECIAALGEDVLIDLRAALSLDPLATAVEICAALDAFTTIEALVRVLGTELSASVIVDVLDCLGFNLTVDEVMAILEIPEGSR